MKNKIANIIVATGLVVLLTQNAYARFAVPDAGSSCVLVVLGLGALAAIKRFLR
jgi:hypothetical protein